MIKLNECRILNIGDKVECYRNLHDGAFSIRSKKSKLVVATGEGFMLEGVKCRVQPRGNAKVRREHRKNVHAVVDGIYKGECEIDVTRLTELYYDPYKYKTFINRDTGEEVWSADKVYFKNNKCWIVE